MLPYYLTLIIAISLVCHIRIDSYKKATIVSVVISIVVWNFAIGYFLVWIFLAKLILISVPISLAVGWLVRKNKISANSLKKLPILIFFTGFIAILIGEGVSGETGLAVVYFGLFLIMLSVFGLLVVALLNKKS